MNQDSWFSSLNSDCGIKIPDRMLKRDSREPTKIVKKCLRVGGKDRRMFRCLRSFSHNEKYDSVEKNDWKSAG